MILQSSPQPDGHIQKFPKTQMLTGYQDHANTQGLNKSKSCAQTHRINRITRNAQNAQETLKTCAQILGKTADKYCGYSPQNVSLLRLRNFNMEEPRALRTAATTVTFGQATAVALVCVTPANSCA